MDQATLSSNKLIILLSLPGDTSPDASPDILPDITTDTSQQREINLPPQFYKNFEFSKIYIVGKGASTKISKITSLRKVSPNTEIVPLDVDAVKLFIHTPNIDKELIGDAYQAPYTNTTLASQYDIDEEVDTLFFTAEKGSFFDKIPFRYQLASIVKPHKFPFYIKEKKISSFADFEEEELFYEGRDLLKCYLTAGFHLLQNNANVPGWCVTPNLSWISLILSLYNVVKMSSDFMWYQEFISYGRMRALVCYLTINELRKISKPSSSSQKRSITAKEEEFIENYLDKKIFKEIFGNSKSNFVEWTTLENYL